MATPSAPQPPSRPAPPTFSSLPPEIHIKTYEHYFTPPHPSADGLPRLHRLGTLNAAYTGTNILLTNRQIHDEALPVFYATHTFTFRQSTWPHNDPYYVAPKYNDNFISIAPFLRNISLRVTPALFHVAEMQAFRCKLNLDLALHEMLERCPLLRTLTIELNSKSSLGQRQQFDDPDSLGNWFLTGRPLDLNTKSFWLFQKARIRIEIGSATFASHAGEVAIPGDRQPLYEVLLCDMEKFTGRGMHENGVWYAAFMAALVKDWVKFEGDGDGDEARDPRGEMVGWTQTGSEIWRETSCKRLLKATK
ncbi:MAG: hypothetical protein OHK93_006354 [Ramalina farinacea]|uniref:Uncharacterized protein n=1 Tax=Ramalina farinacea TaxID=258253 RepID=A0AA43QZ83_9LECA|nr:hypothetical protein [Ramalina farinacea]